MLGLSFSACPISFCRSKATKPKTDVRPVLKLINANFDGRSHVPRAYQVDDGRPMTHFGCGAGGGGGRGGILIFGNPIVGV